MNKKGQLTIFIIIAIFIVGAVTIFFISRESFTLIEIPSNIDPFSNHFFLCLQDIAVYHPVNGKPLQSPYA